MSEAGLTFSERGQTHRLALTGETERVFLIFRVYEIAHYAERGGRQPMSPDAVVEDGPAKALQITFSRTLGLEQIRDEFDKSLRRNAQPEWLADAKGSIDAFLQAIDRDAHEGDELIIYWLAGGRFRAEFNGEPAFSVTDTAFARLVWSIWFGDDPVCDREELLAQATAGTAP